MAELCKEREQSRATMSLEQAGRKGMPWLRKQAGSGKKLTGGERNTHTR